MRNIKFWKQISILVAILGLFLMKGECSADTNWAASANGATIEELPDVQGDPYQSIQNAIDGGRFTLYYREYHGNYPFDFTATAYYTLEITPPQTITTLNNIKYWADWVCGVDTVDGGWASELNKTVSVMVKQGVSWTEVGTDTSVGGVTLTGPWQNVDAIRIYLAGSRDVWHNPSGAEVEAWVRVSCYELEAWGIAGNPPPDTTPPTGTISIHGDAQYTNSTAVVLTLTAEDSESGVSKMKLSNDGTNWTPEEDYVRNRDWTLTSSEGTKPVYVQYKDNAGNWSSSISDTIVLDMTLPTGTISINNGAEYTNSTSVTLNLSASDTGSEVSKMMFSNDGTIWTGEENYATSKSWTLTSGDGTKTVYVRYKDNAGNWSNSVSDTIILDTIPDPVLSVSPTSLDFGTSGVNLPITVSNTGGGTLDWEGGHNLDWLSLSKTSGSLGAGSSENITATVTRTGKPPGTYNGTISFISTGGDKDVSVSMTVADTTPPTGTISINNGAQYTNSPTVTLYLSANDDYSGVSKMKFSNDGANWTTEEQYNTSKSWTLPGSDGTKRVYVQYKDGAGNWSSDISDTIILDTTPPGAPVNVDDGVDGWSGNNTPTFTWESPGDISGIAGYWWAVDDDTPETGGTWTTGATATTAELSDGEHRFYVKAQNGCGLIGPAGSHICQIDATVPTGTISINNGAERTNSTSVTLSLWASTGVVKMKFSNDRVGWTAEEDFTKNKSWTLPGDDGLKRVYVKYKNNAGKESADISDTIILDRVSPKVKLSVEKAKQLHDKEIVGAIPDTGMEAKFSKLMRITTAEKGLELIAEKDNLNRAINEKVPLKFDWVSSSETVRLTPESGELKKNYVYKLQVTNWVIDLASNTVTGERELTFRTIMDHTKKNVVVKSTDVAKPTDKVVTVTLEANALKEDGYLIINTEPLNYQFEVNPGAINAANEKSLTDGWYPIEGCLWEIKACKENGEWMNDNFGSEVKINFPYDEGGSLREEILLAFWLNEEHSNWVRVPGSRVDRESNVVVTGEVPNFSVFALLGTALYDLSDAHAYPVPWKPNDGKDETGTEEGGITFTNLAAECVIKIYTISGELVMKHDYKGGGNWTWDVKTSNKEKVFSGVYIYYIEGEKTHKTGRLVIIR